MFGVNPESAIFCLLRENSSCNTSHTEGNKLWIKKKGERGSNTEVTGLSLVENLLVQKYAITRSCGVKRRRKRCPLLMLATLMKSAVGYCCVFVLGLKLS